MPFSAETVWAATAGCYRVRVISGGAAEGSEEFHVFCFAVV